MNERELSKFEENVVKGASLAFQRLVKKRKEENGELVFARNGQIFRVKVPWDCPKKSKVISVKSKETLR